MSVKEPEWVVMFKNNDGIFLQDGSRIVEYSAEYTNASVEKAIQYATEEGYLIDEYTPILVDISQSLTR